MSTRYPLFVKRDLDGFFGLAIDNLVQLLLIVTLCGAFCGMSGDDNIFIYKYILPGAAVSIIIGNLFYAAQAHWVARREKRSDVTALPYGINTPSLLVYVFFVMMPAYKNTGSAGFAWQMGLVACLGSGVIEFVGAFLAERLRRNTPRAALLGTLAGIAITFISMTFALQIWQRPLVSMAPMAVILLVYFARIRFPLGLPGGFVAVLLGTGLAWLFSLAGVDTGVLMSAGAVAEASGQAGRHLPQWVAPVIWQVLRDNPTQAVSYLSVIVPMGLFNVIGSLQNIESAEAGGDVYATGPSLAVNGIGTITAALFGSCFPTTIYIGHPGWKALGARAGYSTLNGVAITAICLTGTVGTISQIIPMEAGIAIVLWIGIVITAQAFQATPVRHAPAVALGLFPAIAAWGSIIVLGALTEANRNPVDNTMRVVAVADLPAAEATPGPAGTAPATSTATEAPASAHAAVAASQPAEPTRLIATSAQDLLESEHRDLGANKAVVSGFLVHGMIVLERGYIFTCMIIAAVSAFLIDRRFFQAAGWIAAAAVMTFLGLMHAYQLSGNVVDYWLIGTNPQAGGFTYSAVPVAIGYLMMAVVFVAIGYRERNASPLTGRTLEDARVVDDSGQDDTGVAV